MKRLTLLDLQQMFPHPRGDNTPFELVELQQDIFNAASMYSKDYIVSERAYSNKIQAVDWKTQTIDGCQFLIAPVGTYKVHVASNWYTGTMNEFTFGAAITLMLYNHRVWKFSDSKYDVSYQSDHYYSMLNAALSSPLLDGVAIARFLD